LVEASLEKEASAVRDSKEVKVPVGAHPPAWPRAFPKFQLRPLSRAASAHLDLIRATAAWLVLWGHIRNLFFVDFESVQHRSPLVKAIYFFTGFGHQSVVVFFVLSGFLIGSTVLKRFVSGNWSWRAYAIDRLTRLYVVLIPGLLLGLMWDKTGSVIFASTGLYSHTLASFGTGVVQSRLTVRAFLGNLAFLQTLVSPVFGSNGPLWSLANEFWYYALFPIGLSAVVAWANNMVRRAVPLTALVICVAAFVRSPILPGFLIWMAGCIVVVAYSKLRLRHRIWRIAYLLLSFTAMFTCLVAARIRGTGPLASDFTLGVMFSIFLFGVLEIEFRKSDGAYPKVAHLLAGFSYTLYVLHFPLVLFLRAWLAPPQRWQPDPTHVFYALIVGVVTLIVAWIVSLFTEKKTGAVRAWVDNIILRIASDRFVRQTAYATEHAAPSTP
jgi:peptidoglycan/LPS O-acetylase OafA/YrhL